MFADSDVAHRLLGAPIVDNGDCQRQRSILGGYERAVAVRLLDKRGVKVDEHPFGCVETHVQPYRSKIHGVTDNIHLVHYL